MRVGLAADHGGFELKQHLVAELKAAGHDVEDLGAHELVPTDDYPDFIIPLARAVARGEVERGIAVCGSGVGACVVANKVRGVRATVIHDQFTARQGVEDDDVNLICLGGRNTSGERAGALVRTFLASRFSAVERHTRRLQKIIDLENRELPT